MSPPRSRVRADAIARPSPSAALSRTSRGERRLRALARLAIPERPVARARGVEPGAGRGIMRGGDGAVWPSAWRVD